MGLSEPPGLIAGGGGEGWGGGGGRWGGGDIVVYNSIIRRGKVLV